MLGQALKLIGLSNTVLIQILPDTQVIELLVLGVEDTIVVGVQITQCIEPIGCFLSIALDEIDTKQLAAIINLTVAIAVPDEESIIFINPSSTCFYTIIVKIELNPRTQTYRFQAISIKI
ncbi:hypothetical protein RN02_11365 [Pseudomonas sp. PI1]|nr:hypothetical protein RN02_11365 [Pseudomonas sp. PI1]